MTYQYLENKIEELEKRIEALEQEPCKDAIKYFNAIYELSQTMGVSYDFIDEKIKEITKTLKLSDIPLVTPTYEKCKECKKDFTKCGRCPVSMKWVKEHKKEVEK